jgi:hypothetical protein
MAMSADIKPSKWENIQKTFVVIIRRKAPGSAQGWLGWVARSVGGVEGVRTKGNAEGWRTAVGLTPACRVHKSQLTIV